jgi:hypothetical protein
LPIPVATVVLAVFCELMLVHAYAGRYVSMFVNDTWSRQKAMQ